MTSSTFTVKVNRSSQQTELQFTLDFKRFSTSNSENLVKCRETCEECNLNVNVAAKEGKCGCFSPPSLTPSV